MPQRTDRLVRQAGLFHAFQRWTGCCYYMAAALPTLSGLGFEVRVALVWSDVFSGGSTIGQPV